ncbi:hypothetical protein FW774_07700 [Pedobacter sp. BS3]|uniref:hypothetical protein n=1 Tax=Pedobacter sp. BS3 TaxID=2567937 RepID=UPI0011EF794D|nr:hypothetical protein [Pedobacter sp. BS3]TZF84852.1 hypothetical protein FW774_07700 [Pedobacter sp. BS3]
MKAKYTIVLLYAVAFFAVVSCKKSSKALSDDTTTGTDLYDKTQYVTGAVIYGSNKYTRIIVGSMDSPIILSSPHDGTMEPDNIPDRTNPNAETVRDIYATDLTFRIADSLEKKTGLRPHIIINMLSRKKMDPNRSLEDAYLTHNDAIQAWKDYQNFITIARQIVIEHIGNGLYLDMHGHGHDKARIEVGYLLSKNELNSTDADINSMASESSIYAIAKSSSASFSQLIRGDNALGTLLANNNCPAVPSKQDPKPNTDSYFNGGYCTLTYGSKSGGTISAIQLETPGTNRNTSSIRQISGGRIANAVISYMKVHYNMDLAKTQ